MTKEALTYITNLLTSNGINYGFIEYNDEIVYPYFVGEYQEQPSLTEDGSQESLFILNGFTRKSANSTGQFLELETIKENLRNILGSEGLTDTLPSGSVIVIIFQDSAPIRTYDEELNRIQINLKIKEWRV